MTKTTERRLQTGAGMALALCVLGLVAGVAHVGWDELLAELTTASAAWEWVFDVRVAAGLLLLGAIGLCVQVLQDPRHVLAEGRFHLQCARVVAASFLFTGGLSVALKAAGLLLATGRPAIALIVFAAVAAIATLPGVFLLDITARSIRRRGATEE